MTSKLLPPNSHPSWADYLTNERLAQLEDIENKIGTGYDPAPHLVLRFLTTDLTQMQVVILGQDPYPQPGVARGRAFEVGGLTSWLDNFPQSSLRNIVRLLYRTYKGINDYAAIPKFQQIREEIRRGTWQILPPHKLFAAWEAQGVLLLNTCFTVKGKPGEHAAIWLDFTRELLQYISEVKPNLHWFLWGKHAQSFMPYISSGIFHCSRHPMLCSPRYEDDFLRSDCFHATRELINWLGV
ncbi:MAG: uracil-DNA glycosylase [Firmicutes bacterium]|nr:uracil-DNA glycosylase [Bacillota bacterium]